MLETLHKQVVPLLLHPFKIHLGLLRLPPNIVKILVSLGKLLPRLVQLLHGLHVGRLDPVDGGGEITDLLLKPFLNLPNIISLVQVLQAAIETTVVNLDLLFLFINDMAGLAGTHLDARIFIIILNLRKSPPPHGDVDAIHLALLEDGVSGGPLIVQAGLYLVDLLADTGQVLLHIGNILLSSISLRLNLVNLTLQ